MYASDTIYNDMDVAQIESLSPSAPHRNVDLAIVAADQEGYVKIYIILPPTIYGLATGKLVDLGVQNPHSIQIPGLIKYLVHRGQVGMVGDGKNIVSFLYCSFYILSSTLLVVADYRSQ